MINSAHRTLDHTARRHGLSISLSTLPRSAVHNIRKRCMLSRHCSRLQSEVLSVCLSVCPLAHFREHTSTFPVRFACDRGGVALYCRLLSVLCKPMTSRFQQVITQRAARRYVHMSTADGSSTRGGSTSVRDGSAVRTSLVVGQLQAASVRIA